MTRKYSHVSQTNTWHREEEVLGKDNSHINLSVCLSVCLPLSIPLPSPHSISLTPSLSLILHPSTFLPLISLSLLSSLLSILLSILFSLLSLSSLSLALLSFHLSLLLPLSLSLSDSCQTRKRLKDLYKTAPVLCGGIQKRILALNGHFAAASFRKQ